MSTWAKLDSDIRNNGKIAEAGPDGALLYLSLLCLHTAKGKGGVVPSSCCKPARLRVEAGAFLGTFDVARIENAIDACVEAQLVDRVDDDGAPCAQVGVLGAQVRAACALRLRGWCDEHAVACSHCRKPNPEPSHKTCPTCREARHTDRNPSKDAGARRLRAHGAKRAHVGAGRAQMAALVSDSVSVSDNPPYPPRAEPREGIRADARGADASRGPEADPEKPGPEPTPARRPANEPTPVADLTAALLRTRYRAGIDNAIVRRGEVRSRAAELVKTGLAPGDVHELWRLATEKSKDDPGALLAHWLDENIWRETLDEQVRLAKESGEARRAREAADADPLAGVYGS
jgi:hypothetical protein